MMQIVSHHIKIAFHTNLHLQRVHICMYYLGNTDLQNMFHRFDIVKKNRNKIQKMRKQWH